MSGRIRMWWSPDQNEWIVKLYMEGTKTRAAFQFMDSAQDALEHCRRLAAMLGQ